MRQQWERGAYLRPASGARVTIRMLFKTKSQRPSPGFFQITDAERTVNMVSRGQGPGRVWQPGRTPPAFLERARWAFKRPRRPVVMGYDCCSA
jgi:hypothetical protein